MLGLGGGRLCEMVLEVGRSRKAKGGFSGGRTPLGPGLPYQSDALLGEPGVLLQFRMNCWNAVNLADGMSASATWLAMFGQFLKQSPRMNHLGHILQVPFQSTLSLKHLLA